MLAYIVLSWGYHKEMTKEFDTQRERERKVDLIERYISLRQKHTDNQSDNQYGVFGPNLLGIMEKMDTIIKCFKECNYTQDKAELEFLKILDNNL